MEKIEDKLNHLLVMIYVDFKTQPQFISSRRQIDYQIFNIINDLGGIIQQLVTFELILDEKLSYLSNLYFIKYNEILICTSITTLQKNSITELLNLRCSKYMTYSIENELYESSSNFAKFDKKLIKLIND